MTTIASFIIPARFLVNDRIETFKLFIGYKLYMCIDFKMINVCL